MRQLKIGSLKLANPLLLAPMVDVTDLPYRLICKKAGAALTYVEMLYISAIIHENKKTQALMKTIPKERPVGIQITGNNVEEFKGVLPYLKPYNLVDINCGCPSVRITGNQAGSYLLKNPSKIADMIKILKGASIPVTAKIRLGFKNNNVLEVAKTVEKAGADALTVHARLAHHGASVPADWSWIKKVKETIGIPVIGNGDIVTGEHAAKMLDIADGAMIARAAIGDPLVFTRMLHYLKTGKEQSSDFKKNIVYFKQYLTLAHTHKIFDLSRSKFVGTSFLKGVKGAAQLRQELMQKKTYEEMSSFIKKVASEYP